MNWDWINTTLMIIGLLFIAFGLVGWVFDDSGYFILVMLGIIAIGGAGLRTLDHNEQIENAQHLRELQTQGFNIISVSYNDAVIGIGICKVHTEMERIDGRLLLFVTKSSGERVRYTLAQSQLPAPACV